MSFDPKTLYNLLPAIYRIRDAQGEEPLQQLLAVIADQVAVLEEDLAQLYDDQFIETCADWVIPYIGDAVGYRLLHGKIPKVSSPRGEVADTFALRRHKGTAAMLEVLAREVTGWDAHVVEFFQLLVTTQYMKHVRPGIVLPNLREWEPLERLGTAFEVIAHIPDVHRIASGRGRFNIPNIGIYLWRLSAYSLTDSPAFRLDDHRFLFSPLGNNTPLFTRPVSLGSIDEFTGLSDRLNVPMPISRRIADRYLEDYYGRDKSFQVLADGQDVGVDPANPTKGLRDLVSICDLSDVLDANGQPTGAWAHVPLAGGKVAIDPVLGRIAFPGVPGTVRVLFHYGFSADLGGGEYDRQESVARWYPREMTVDWQIGVTKNSETIATAPDPSVLVTTVQDAVAAWHTQSPGTVGLICIMDSDTYPEPLDIQIPEGSTLAIVAADWPIDDEVHQRKVGVLSPNGRRPLLSGDVTVTGTAAPASEAPGTLVLDGLLISGTLTVEAGHLGRLSLSHCTVVPWTTLAVDRVPEPSTAARLINRDDRCRLEADHCILGALRSPEETRVSLENCILDATQETAVAYAAPDGTGAGARLRAVNCTMIGRVHTLVMELASNCIFLARVDPPDPGWPAPVIAERRQQGCVRFSSVPHGARLPRRYRCQPDLALEQLAKALNVPSAEDIPASDQVILVNRLRPTFRSLRYGNPDYGQLSRRCPPEIREGAEDEAEMGAFHDLYQPQRERNLRLRLDEYLRFGLEAGILYAT